MPFLENDAGIIIVPTGEVEDAKRVHHLILAEDFTQFTALQELLLPHTRTILTNGRPHVSLTGEEIARMDENDLAIYRQTKVGFVFQSFNLIASMSAEENVAFPMRFAGISGKARKQRSLQLLEEVGLKDRIGHKPTELSGGQQQRVAVARALINDPPLILADEPTGNLDSNSGFSIMELLFSLHRSGKTVVVVTHDQRMIQYATNIIYILDGHIVTEAEFKKATQLHRKQALV
jgi:ABC-type lipoprotein export system ATPase subunit